MHGNQQRQPLLTRYPVALYQGDAAIGPIPHIVLVLASDHAYGLLLPIPDGVDVEGMNDEEFHEGIAGPVASRYREYCEYYVRMGQSAELWDALPELPPRDVELKYQTIKLVGFVGPINDDDPSTGTTSEIFLYVAPSAISWESFFEATLIN
jgi:hypothetical protein